MKSILLTIVLTCFLSCSEDLTEYYTRLDQREIANKSQEQANSKQEQQNVNQQNKNQQLRLEGEELRRRLTELEQSLVTVPDPKIRSVYFFKEENPGLSGNVKCDILGDSIIDCWLPGGIRDEKLRFWCLLLKSNRNIQCMFIHIQDFQFYILQQVGVKQ